MSDGTEAIRVSGKELEASKTLYGPYRVLQVTPTSVEVRLLDQPKSDSIFVALERVRRCYPEQGDTTWTGHNKHRKKSRLKGTTQPTGGEAPQPQQGPVTCSKS